jgi:hypothetical protein
LTEEEILDTVGGAADSEDDDDDDSEPKLKLGVVKEQLDNRITFFTVKIKKLLHIMIT